MVSSELTRRRTLLGAAGALAALAGCSGSGSAGDDVTPTEPARDPFDPDSVPAHRRLRGATDGPLVWIPDETRTRTDGEPRRRLPTFVTSREEVDRLRFADVDGVEAARSFLAETTFDTETIYLEEFSVRRCYELQLCDVSWSETDIDTQFGRVLRDADVACEPDARDATAWLVRLPEALDPDRITSYGSGVSGSSCGERRRRPERGQPITADAVPASNATAEGDDA
ncbi:hypothetical protein [Halobaculum magnesiiphilum]|uniref:Uncharacterized protein n=1 Tax=Halobaculum magnesiiphilum TaxID=1017351 RepID=A0A8T8WAC5_9EURY|nr:hypothetical protein [Halobaculum magnesiiphilum]QZP36790.1 hypothetical protein K6T50_10805 [Halobaculum magnesiiphilum]